jgi:hypothetical protein
MIAARAAMSHKAVAIHIKNLKLWMPVPLVPLIFYPPFTSLGQDKYFIFGAPPLSKWSPVGPPAAHTKAISWALPRPEDP